MQIKLIARSLLACCTRFIFDPALAQMLHLLFAAAQQHFVPQNAVSAPVCQDARLPLMWPSTILEWALVCCQGMGVDAAPFATVVHKLTTCHKHAIVPVSLLSEGSQGPVRPRSGPDAYVSKHRLAS